MTSLSNCDIVFAHVSPVQKLAAGYRLESYHAAVMARRGASIQHCHTSSASDDPLHRRKKISPHLVSLKFASIDEFFANATCFIVKVEEDLVSKACQTVA